jgi:predicted RNase H-like nuclease (RuvC/YqgF family)
MDTTGTDRRSMHIYEQDHRRDAETIKALSGLREDAERKAQALQDELRNQGAEVLKLKRELQETRARSQMVPPPPTLGEHMETRRGQTSCS